MPSLINAIISAQSALLAQQANITVASHNLANADSEGYSRQSAVLAPLAGTSEGGNFYGLGVDVQTVTRSRDEFLDRSYRSESGESSRAMLLDDTWAQVNEAFGDPADGALVSALANFWSSWQDLANDPESAATRVSVQTAGQSLAREFSRLSERLKQLCDNTTDTERTAAGEINRLARQIADLNAHIVRETSQNRAPNDLLDERDRLLDKLAEWGNISVEYKQNGSLLLHFGDSVLVEDDRVLPVRFDESSGTIRWQNAAREITITSGKAGGAQQFRNAAADLLSRLDEIAVAIAREVNSIHRSGTGLDGSSGADFFAANITGAGDFGLDPAIAANAQRIAASGAQGAGDGLIARAIGQLNLQQLIGNRTIGEAFSDLIGIAGANGSTATSDRTRAEAGLQQAANWRSSVSGVSVDEETVALMKHQQAYAAAAKVYATVNAMMDALLLI